MKQIDESKTKKEFIFRVTMLADGSEHFFWSVSAMFDVFEESELGCNPNILYKCGVSPEKPYQNDICKIDKLSVLRRVWSGREKHTGY